MAGDRTAMVQTCSSFSFPLRPRRPQRETLQGDGSRSGREGKRCGDFLDSPKLVALLMSRSELNGLVYHWWGHQKCWSSLDSERLTKLSRLIEYCVEADGHIRYLLRFFEQLSTVDEFKGDCSVTDWQRRPFRNSRGSEIALRRFNYLCRDAHSAKMA